MHYFSKIIKLTDSYLLARLQNRPSTAFFWYLPEPAVIHTAQDLAHYQTPSAAAPLYLIDYRQKLRYPLKNEQGIIVLPYDEPIGQQVNPEAAFQYALGLHDAACIEKNTATLTQFFNYADYFVAKQSSDGLWSYDFDWFAAKAPWYSALAQARGASVMLRAWLQSKEAKYLESAKKALGKFLVPTAAGGFLQLFPAENCYYFEEYPNMPTGVINGFMAALISIWELNAWLKEAWLAELWKIGLDSLQKMLPYYSTGWWSLYDLDKQTPVLNVNSPRYHALEIQYLKVLSILSSSPLLRKEHDKRVRQYNNKLSRLRALSLKVIRKIIYK